jgi:hypothetical protein
MRIRIPLLSAAILLAVLAPAAARHRASTPVPTAGPTEYTPPAVTGDIYTVIDFARDGGDAQPVYITAVLGERRRDLVVPPRYNCLHATPAGVVLRVRHFTPDSTPLLLTTTGKIVRGPYQGDLPLEVLHPCYSLVK